MKSLPFRWNYITLPVAIFLLSILLSALFYHQLPARLAVHFELDGTPDRWLSREMTMVFVLTPQLLLTLLAGAITWGITRLTTLFRQIEENARIKPESIVSLMGNMIALPQLIICFAMIYIFSYNAYQVHVVPIWVLLLIIIGLTTIAMGLFFVFAMAKAKRPPILQSKAKED